MPIRDLFHPVVRRALEREGWEITDDPLRIVVSRRSASVYLGEEQLIGARRGTAYIAVVRSYLGTSEIQDLETALGQFMLYERLLRKDQPERSLWLAVPSCVWSGLCGEALGELLLEDGDIRVLVINEKQQAIEQWIPSAPGARLSCEFG